MILDDCLVTIATETCSIIATIQRDSYLNQTVSKTCSNEETKKGIEFKCAFENVPGGRVRGKGVGSEKFQFWTFFVNLLKSKRESHDVPFIQIMLVLCE